MYKRQGGAIALSSDGSYAFLALADNTNPFGPSTSGHVYAYPVSNGNLGNLASTSSQISINSLGSIAVCASYVYMGTDSIVTPQSQPQNIIAGFSFINGQFADLAGSPYSTGGHAATAFAVNSQNNDLYVAGYTYDSRQTDLEGFVWSYDIDTSTGELSFATEPVTSYGNSPWSLALSDTSSSLYVANLGPGVNSNIVAFTTSLSMNISTYASSFKELTSVAYGDEKFVAIGYQVEPINNYVPSGLVSTDGSTWSALTTLPTINNNNALNGMYYVNGQFVILSYQHLAGSTQVHMSSDTETWTTTSVSLSNGGFLNDITWGSGVWVAIGKQQSAEGNYIARSTDNGTSWTVSNHIPKNQWNSIAYGNNLFVAVGVTPGLTASVISTSTDGNSWTDHVINDSLGQGFDSVVYSEQLSLFIATGTHGIVYTSTDGSTWTKQNTPPEATATPVGIGSSETQPNMLIAPVNNGSDCLLSQNGNNWYGAELNINDMVSNNSNICWGDNQFLVIGHTNIYSISFS